MITSIRGTVQHIEEGSLTLEVNGIGFRIAITNSVLDAGPEIGKPFFMHTFLVVREDELSLYGFSTSEQLSLFKVLLGISGIGPKLALAILSHLSPDVLRSAVVNQQAGVLAQVPGVGKKTGEKIIFHLKDVLSAPMVEEPLPGEFDTEVLDALTTLGYSLVEAQAAVQSIPEDTPEDVEERIRVALRYFAKP
ncbi:MAG: Holliday junction branch migration protein RuvA [Anaerolineales bacterium]|nr:Holliday junction branch migration protein RuvA [Anaerolineales bacterium]